MNSTQAVAEVALGVHKDPTGRVGNLPPALATATVRVVWLDNPDAPDLIPLALYPFAAGYRWFGATDAAVEAVANLNVDILQADGTTPDRAMQRLQTLFADPCWALVLTPGDPAAQVIARIERVLHRIGFRTIVNPSLVLAWLLNDHDAIATLLTMGPRAFDANALAAAHHVMANPTLATRLALMYVGPECSDA